MLALCDRIAVMNRGRVSQLGTPQEIHGHPTDPFVADFNGSSYLAARTLYLVDVGGSALRIESDVLFNSGDVWVEILEASCVLFPAEGSDLS